MRECLTFRENTDESRWLKADRWRLTPCFNSTARATVAFEQNLGHTADAAGAAFGGGVEFDVAQAGHSATIDADEMRMTAVIRVARVF